MKRALPDLSRSEWEHLIDEWIFHARTREVLKEWIFDGVTIEQLAEIHEVSVSTINADLRKGFDKLFKHIKKGS